MGTSHSVGGNNNFLRYFKMMLHFAVAAIFVGLANADIVPDVMIPDVCYQKKVGDTYTCFARTGKVCVTHFNSTDPCGQHAADCEVPCDEQEKSCLQRWGDCMAKPVQRDRYDCRNALLNTNACSQAFVTSCRNGHCYSPCQKKVPECRWMVMDCSETMREIETNREMDKCY